eukprot:scaffold6910_cov136-Isochrysis_galbana.AAC.2
MSNEATTLYHVPPINNYQAYQLKLDSRARTSAALCGRADARPREASLTISIGRELPATALQGRDLASEESIAVMSAAGVVDQGIDRGLAELVRSVGRQ